MHRVVGSCSWTEISNFHKGSDVQLHDGISLIIDTVIIMTLVLLTHIRILLFQV